VENVTVTKTTTTIEDRKKKCLMNAIYIQLIGGTVSTIIGVIWSKLAKIKKIEAR
jgi:hypothetical protein